MTLSELPAALGRFGLGGTCKLLVSRRRLKWLLPAWTERLQVRPYPFPFHFRHGTTDKYVVAEVLLRQQYKQLLDLENVRTIVDAGANIGTASVFLLNAYPKARLIALEPDPGNCSVLRRNLAYYGDRAVVVQQALWPRSEALVLERGGFRDGGEWSIQVKVGHSSTDAVAGTTVQDLADGHGLGQIDILKIDIEGAERELFNEGNPSSWLKHVRTLAIELHDQECRAAFERAIRSLSGELTRDGELTIWRSDS